MRVLVFLFFFVNLLGSASLLAERLTSTPEFYPSITSNLSFSNFSIYDGSSIVIGEALPISFVPERPVVRSIQNFLVGQNMLLNISGFFAICDSLVGNYLKLSLTIDPCLPAFLIVFPHHNFT
jgi:hypothetical protein